MTAYADAFGGAPREIAAAARALNWAGGLLAADGSFRGAEDQVGAYYLAPMAFVLGGRADLAQMVAGHVRRDFFESGDINSRMGEAGSQVATFRNAFFGLSCQRLGAFDLAFAQSDRLERRQHRSLGGFANNDRDDRVLEFGSTAAALICLLSTGHIAAARAAGDFLAEAMIGNQPDPETRILLRRSWGGEWIEDFADDEAARHKIAIGAPSQTYWFLGIAMVALGQLYLAAGGTKYLAAAEQVFGWAEACTPGAFEDLTAAKVGWGAAVLYAATGMDRYAERARTVSGMLIDTQTPEGAWLRRPAVTQLAGQDVATLLDTSLERVCWLIEIARNLSVTRELPDA